MTPDELIHRLGSLLVGDPEVAVKPDWTHLVMVGTVTASETDLTGFCYGPGGQFASVAPSAFDTPDVLKALRDAMAARDGQAPWHACLLRIERTSGRIAVDFEYDDPARWAITFANAKQRAAELRPA